MNGMSEKERSIRDIFIRKCWSYLHDNFHKFNESNQIKIALTLAQRDMPEKVEGMSQQVVIMGEIKRQGSPVRYNLGTNFAEASSDPGEAISNN